MMQLRNMKEIAAKMGNRKYLLCSALRLGLARTRIARISYEALWYVRVCKTVREIGIARSYRLRNPREDSLLKVQFSLRSEKIAKQAQ